MSKKWIVTPGLIQFRLECSLRSTRLETIESVLSLGLGKDVDTWNAPMLCFGAPAVYHGKYEWQQSFDCGWPGNFSILTMSCHQDSIKVTIEGTDDNPGFYEALALLKTIAASDRLDVRDWQLSIDGDGCGVNFPEKSGKSLLIDFIDAEGFNYIPGWDWMFSFSAYASADFLVLGGRIVVRPYVPPEMVTALLT